MRHKRASLRRWKARCHLGQAIPYVVLIDYQLSRWFLFDAPLFNSDHVTAIGCRR